MAFRSAALDKLWESLQRRGEHRRQPWYGTACCPPNLARTLASLPGCITTTSDEGVWVHLFATCAMRVAVPGGTPTLRVETAYHWEGEITLTVIDASAGPWTLFLRVPGWAGETAVALDVNRLPANTPTPGSYAGIRREWANGDTVRLHLPMEMQAIASHPHARENAGRVASMRGSLVYCAEGVDHPGTDVWNIAVRPDAEWETKWHDALGSIVAVSAPATVIGTAADVPRYHPVERGEPRTEAVLLRPPSCAFR